MTQKSSDLFGVVSDLCVMCGDCGDRPTTVAAFQQWYTDTHPASDIDFSIISDDHLRVVGGHIPILCNICGYDTRDRRLTRHGGQSYRNIWYNHNPCGSCFGDVSREPEYWQREAIALYSIDEIDDDLTSFLPNSPTEKVGLICNNCGGSYRKSVKEMRVRAGHRRCRNIRRRTRDKFIESATAVHSSRNTQNDDVFPFVYDRVQEFPINGEEVEIGCLRCADSHNQPRYFNQAVQEHLNGFDGCPNCQRRSEWTWTDLEEYFNDNDAGEIEIDLSRLDYQAPCGSHEPVPVICGQGHADTKILTNIVNSTTGMNCKRCSYIRRGLAMRTTRERFIEIATSIQVHLDDDGGPRYFYGRVPDTLRHRDTVEIYCFECEEYFDQVANYHLSGNGHRACNPGGFNLNLPAIAYLLRISINGDFAYWKFGITNHSAEDRAADIRQSISRLGHQGDVQVVQHWDFDTGQEALDTETAVHQLRIIDGLTEDEYTPAPGMRFEGWTELFPPHYDPRVAMTNHGIIL